MFHYTFFMNFFYLTVYFMLVGTHFIFYLNVHNPPTTDDSVSLSLVYMIWGNYITVFNTFNN